MKGVLSWTRSLIFMNHSTVFVYRISFLFVSLWHPIFFFVFSLPKEGHVHMTMTRCLVFSYVHGTVRTCCLLWGSSRAVCTRSVVARQWCILLVSGFHLVGASRGCRDLVGSSALHACSAGFRRCLRLARLLDGDLASYLPWAEPRHLK